MGRWRRPGVQSWTTAANTLFFAALEPVGRRVGSARNAPRSPPWLWLGLARVLQTASVHFVPMSWRALAGLSMTGSHPKLTAQASAPHEAFANLYKFASGAVQNRIARACPRRETIRQAASLFDNAAQHPSRTSRQLRHKYTNHHSHGAACLPESAAPLPRGGRRGHESIRAQVEGRRRRGPRRVQADPQVGQQPCGNQNFTARSS